MYLKIIIVVLILHSFGKCDIYTATDTLKKLLYTHDHIIKTMEKYIRAEEKKIELLRRYMQIYKQENDKAFENPQLYIENPINAFILIKRLTVDWRQIESLVQTDVTVDPLKNINKKLLTFPSDQDLSGAALAISRIIVIYLLNIKLMANGQLNGIKYRQKLSASDCFELGRQSYLNEKYDHSSLWLKEAASKLKDETYSTVNKEIILEYMALTCYKQGNITSALHFTNRLLRINPKHSKALKNKKYFDKIKNDKNIDNYKPFSINSYIQPDIDPSDKDDYHKLCRQETISQQFTSHKLKCRYLSNIPFLFIAPFKIEEAYLDPEIYLFHDVLGDREIETLKKMAQPLFTRGSITYGTNSIEITQIRICEVAYLEDHKHKYITDLSQRVKDMTGLTMEIAEQLQVVNYGIGGHYEPHFDIAGKNDSHRMFGRRIATILFYMSDVSSGATVFPELGLTLWPQKGTAVVWFNLHRSGDGDIRTRHAACPVLIGSKWVTIKWVYEKGQEFRRPCSLTQPPQEQIFDN